jgi:pimeloyl-ACP methyl ester carboxylesterase
MAMLLLLAAASLQPAMPNDYRREDNWLCRPDRQDACTGDIDKTVVTVDGKARREKPVPPPAPKADCFYVYPTVSLDPTPNSDMFAGAEESGMAAAQLAEFRNACRLFAPLYRQVTLSALHAMMRQQPDGADHELPYADVRAAWRDYLAHDNRGRPFVLVGHSQGSALLKRLLAEEIDGKPVQRRLLSAILPGTAVLVPKGRDMGGDLKAVPLCRSDSQTGCVVTWASYRDTAVLPSNALFGKSAVPGLEAGCTNPAKPGGGAASLDSVLGYPWWRGGVAQFQPPAAGWSAKGVPVPTRFVRMPGLLSAECVRRGGFSYLSVHVNAGTARDMIDAVAGTTAIGDIAYPDWGFHVVDMAIVEGDLVRLVRRQSVAWYRFGQVRKK